MRVPTPNYYLFMTSNTTTIFAIIFAAVLIAGALMFSGAGSAGSGEQAPTQQADVNNVTIENGKQIITIAARGGYQPRSSTAKAGVPTVLRFTTNGTFDCSSSIRIPSLSISKVLPQTGTADIDLGTPTAGTLHGTCGMGMYSFQVAFD